MAIEQITRELEDVASRYGLKILHLDVTDVTVLARIGVSEEIFMQVYVNDRKHKKNLALIVAGDRVYGVDNEGGVYHEHPFEKPMSHLESEEISLDTFVVKSLHCLSVMGWLSEDE